MYDNRQPTTDNRQPTTDNRLLMSYEDDLCDFIMNCIGVSFSDAKGIYAKLHKVLMVKCADRLGEDLREAVSFFSMGCESVEKVAFKKDIANALFAVWLEMGLEEVQVEQLVDKLIPFALSILSYELREKEIELNDIVGYNFRA